MLLLSAPSALASEGCLNEAVRTESNINPTTHEPYDMGLPECRAYEMVSPLEKQQHDAIERLQPVRTSVAPEGNAVGWSGQGDYAGAENYQARDAHPNNPYVAQRTTSGWVTRSGYPPITLVENPFTASQASGVYSSDLADETVCGTAASAGENEGPTIRCVLREPDGSWVATPEYTDLTGETFAGALMLGASSNGQDVLFYNDCGIAFLSSDTSRETGCAFQSGVHQGGIYEEVGVGTSSPELRLVNVDSSGVMIGPESESLLGAEPEEKKGRAPTRRCRLMVQRYSLRRRRAAGCLLSTHASMAMKRSRFPAPHPRSARRATRRRKRPCIRVRPPMARRCSSRPHSNCSTAIRTRPATCTSTTLRIRPRTGSCRYRAEDSVT